MQRRYNMICDDCNKDKEDVKETKCPYAEEINDELIDCQLCDGCYYDRCMEI